MWVEAVPLVELVRVSRPGLIASHLWIYLLPLVLAGRSPDAAFWIGALYVTVPLGLLIYGWNDYFDADVDALSRRKGGRMAALFGPRLPASRRRRLPVLIVAAQLPFLALAAWAGEPWAFAWLAVVAAGNWLYNGPGPRLSRLPVVAELTATAIYLAILWLAVQVTGIAVAWPVWALAAAAVLVFQIAGAIVDLRADRRVGKRTLAVAVGERWASRVLAAVLVAKAALLLVAFDSPPAALVTCALVPLCLARPALPRGDWAGLSYVYFVVVDWLCLAILAG